MRYGNWLGFAGGLMACVLVVAVPGTRPRTNPPVDEAHTLEARIHVPAGVSSILKNSCYDCHSNRTQWPWYSRAWPMSSMIAGDVEHARDAMNFSDWPATEDHSGLSAGFLAASCAALRTGNMPPARYLWLHPGARPSKESVETFCAWSMQEVARLAAERHRLRQSKGPDGLAPVPPLDVKHRGGLALISLPR